MKKTIKKQCLYFLLINTGLATIFFFGLAFHSLRPFYDPLFEIDKAIGIYDLFYGIQTHDVLLGFSSFWIGFFITSLPITFLAHTIYLAISKSIAYMRNKDLSHHNDK